ncbi:MAG: LytTR family DNA-binding domain-containing protein [Prolixibacteraceae bacterium]|jgi:two-component system LytT family response regulator|nr:LytTR family DNA-binding domain-containing protein [Prolixibacteraceae bacterium]
MTKHIAINTKENIFHIVSDEIAYCNYATRTFYFKNDETIIFLKGIKEFERLLDDSDLIRPHQSYLANKNHISSIDKVNGYHLTLKNQARIPIFTHRQKAMFDMIKIGL